MPDFSKLTELKRVSGPVPITELTQAQLKELQWALNRLGFPAGDIDGLFGPRTRNAWAEFKIDIFPGNPLLIGPESVTELAGRIARQGSLLKAAPKTPAQTIEAIKEACRQQGLGLRTQIAYVLATTKWETAQTFLPVKEAFWLSENWRKANLRYFPYYGRGYVQLTWKDNYAKYGTILGKDLVGNPDLALEPQIALFVLAHGFKTGTFTGRKLEDFVSAAGTDYVNARRCINGLDRAHEIAAFAEEFEAQV